MVKCIDCPRPVTKRLPGIECTKCKKWRHADCAGMSEDKFKHLVQTENVDWTCKKCNKNPKRLSVIIPDADEDLSGTPQEEKPISNSQLTMAIKAELKKMIKTELMPLQNSTQYSSDKIDDFEEKIAAYEEKLKSMQNKVTDLTNKCSNYELRCQALEQRVAELEQEKLVDTLEVAGVPPKPNENIDEIVKKIAETLKVPTEVAESSRTKRRGNENSDKPDAGYKAPIVLKMKNTDHKKAWIAAGKIAQLKANSIDCSFGENRIFVREALTNHTKTLLWQTKEHLKQTYRFIWSKEGRILVKKDEQAKTINIRSTADIDRLARN